jgi:hypothetical protein
MNFIPIFSQTTKVLEIDLTNYDVTSDLIIKQRLDAFGLIFTLVILFRGKKQH